MCQPEGRTACYYIESTPHQGSGPTLCVTLVFEPHRAAWLEVEGDAVGRLFVEDTGNVLSLHGQQRYSLAKCGRRSDGGKGYGGHDKHRVAVPELVATKIGKAVTATRPLSCPFRDLLSVGLWDP